MAAAHIAGRTAINAAWAVVASVFGPKGQQLWSQIGGYKNQVVAATQK